MADDIVKNVLVIGAGVSGLTTALALVRRVRYHGIRFNVKLFAEHYHNDYKSDPSAPQLVSTIAGALWEFPPAVCGMHGNQLSIARSEKWCMAAYRKFEELTETETPGVSMHKARFFFNVIIDNDRVERVKRDKLEGLFKAKELKSFRDLSAEEITKANDALRSSPTDTEKHVQSGYEMTVPVIETPVYMDWLLEQVTNDPRVEMVKGDGDRYPLRITDRLAPQEEALRDLFGVDAIVNCSALGAAELAGDSMVPLRGGLVAVPRNRFAKGGRTEAIAMAKTKFKQDMVFIVPRKEEVIIGGFAGLRSTGPTSPRTMRRSRTCSRVVDGSDTPMNTDVKLTDADLRLDIGLRPYRAQNVCVEREYGCNIVHNYGHTGAGFSFSYGCADEVVDLVESMEGTAFHTTY